MRTKLDIKTLEKILLCCTKTGKHTVVKGYNHIMNMTFNQAVANFEMQSDAFKEWCKKYPTIEQGDKHIEELERSVKEEFFGDFINNNNKYNHKFKIEKVKFKDQKEEMQM
jgi:hypothetical protein